MGRREENVSGGRRFTVYGLVDPRTDRIHYVGRTSLPLETRRKNHIGARNHSMAGGSKAKRAWIADVLAVGLEPSIRALESFDDLDVANEGETRWIAKGKVEGWPLTNRQMKGGGGNTPKDVKHQRERERRYRDGKTLTRTFRGDELAQLDRLVGVRDTCSINEVVGHALALGLRQLEREQTRRRLSSSSTSPAQTEVA